MLMIEIFKWRSASATANQLWRRRVMCICLTEFEGCAASYKSRKTVIASTARAVEREMCGLCAVLLETSTAAVQRGWWSSICGFGARFAFTDMCSRFGLIGGCRGIVVCSWPSMKFTTLTHSLFTFFCSRCHLHDDRVENETYVCSLRLCVLITFYCESSGSLITKGV